MSVIRKDLGMVTAYAYAVSQGYTGTEEEFAELMASYADVAEEAAESATAAAGSATAAAASASAAQGYKTDAQTAATSAGTSASTATSKASEAANSATQAVGSATAAASSASTASTKATQADTAAGNAATNAIAAAQAASMADTKATDAAASATAAAGSATQAAASASSAASAVDGFDDHVEEMIETIPEDYTDLLEDVSQLKADFTKSLTTMTDPSYWEVGRFDGDGANVTASNRIRFVIPVSIKNIISVSPTNGYEMMVYLFQSDNTIIGEWDGDTIIQGGTWIDRGVTFSNPPTNASKYRVILRKTDDADMSVSDYVGLEITFVTSEATVKNAESVRYLAESISDGAFAVFHQIKGLDLFRTGAINSSGENTNTSAYLNNSYRLAGQEIVNDADYIISSVTQNTETNFYHYVFFYDETFSYLTREGGSKQNTVNALVPNNAKYYRVSLTQITNSELGKSNITDYSIAWAYSNAIITPYLYKKNGIILGDSISYGLYSYWDGTSRKNSDGLSPSYAAKRISDWFAELCGMPVANIASRGTGYVADTRHLGNAKAKATNTDFSDYDFVGLCFGINDYIQGCSIGDMVTDGTIKGNLAYVLQKIYADNPLAKVVVFSPYNAWGQVAENQSSDTLYGDFESNYALGHAISGNTLQDVVDAIDEVCQYYGVTHEKLNKSNVVNRINIKDIMIDGLHPSEASMPMLAAEMFAQKDFG